MCRLGCSADSLPPVSLDLCRQVIVPPTGARLLIASDGVWDAYEKVSRLLLAWQG